MAYENAKKISTSYRIKLSDKKDLLVIMNRDLGFGLETDKKTLWEMLESIEGIYDVDYDGHYGNRIFITVDANNDEYSTWKKLKKCINDFLEGE